MREEIPGWKSVGENDSNDDTLVGKIATVVCLPILGGVVGLLIGLRMLCGARHIDGHDASKMIVVGPALIGAVVGFLLAVWSFFIVARDRVKHRRHMANHIDSDL